MIECPECQKSTAGHCLLHQPQYLAVPSYELTATIDITDALQNKINKLRAALEMVEWIEFDGMLDFCPWCDASWEYWIDRKDNPEPRRHKPDCPRQEALKP